MFLGANLFGEYFQIVYVRDYSQEYFVVDDDGVEDSSTVSLIQLEKETVEQGILALDTQKNPGPDGIFPLILKKNPLIVLFNLSLLSRVFPCVWKESFIVPLIKAV
jgi:hypothetical protein